MAGPSAPLCFDGLKSTFRGSRRRSELLYFDVLGDISRGTEILHLNVVFGSAVIAKCTGRADVNPDVRLRGRHSTWWTAKRRLACEPRSADFVVCKPGNANCVEAQHFGNLQV